MEIYEDLSEVDAVLVSVGGGGLISGIASYMKAINPSIKVSIEHKQKPGLSAINWRNTMVLACGALVEIHLSPSSMACISVRYICAAGP